MNKKLTWTEYATNKLVEKWWPIMSSRIMSDEEISELHKDADQVGINIDDLFNAMIEKFRE